MKPIIQQVIDILIKDKHHPIIHAMEPYDELIKEISQKLPPETPTLEFHKDDISYGGNRRYPLD